MIVDRIEQMDSYCERIPHLAEALRFVRENSDQPEGRYTFEYGFGMIQSGETRPTDADTFEVHPEYFDFHWLLEGDEYILWNKLNLMEADAPFDPLKNRLALRGEGTPLQMKPGMCVILFPTDAHKGNCHLTTPTKYRKFIVKILI